MKTKQQKNKSKASIKGIKENWRCTELKNEKKKHEKKLEQMWGTKKNKIKN